MAAAQVSKLEAVRKALTGLGDDAMPVKIIEFVKKNFGIEMTTGHVSTYKSAILRGKKSKNAVFFKEESTAAPAPAKAPKAVSDNGVSLEDVQTVKLLIERVGEGNLMSLIGLLE